MGTEYDRSTSPTAFVGMPVYNEERYVEEMLESIAAQSYSNLEILIADNCSTDDTGAICERFAQKHDRFTYVRWEENIGVIESMQRVRDRTRGTYFIWAMGHDIWHPQFIERAVQALETNSSATLAFGQTTWIDTQGQPLDRVWVREPSTVGKSLFRRVWDVLYATPNAILGVLRSDAHLSTIHKHTVGIDQVQLLEMAIQGEFTQLDLPFYRRQNREQETFHQRLKRYSKPEHGVAGSFGLLQFPFELLSAVWRAKRSWWVKIPLWLFVAANLAPNYLYKRLKGR